MDSLYLMRDTLEFQIQKYIDELEPVRVRINDKCWWFENKYDTEFLDKESPIGVPFGIYSYSCTNFLLEEVLQNGGQEIGELIDAYKKCVNKIHDTNLCEQYRTCCSILKIKCEELSKAKDEEVKHILDNFMK